jgi:hypothetical protein
VTYINSDHLSATYRLSHISWQGCEPTLRSELFYALTALREFAELSDDEIDSQCNSCRKQKSCSRSSNHSSNSSLDNPTAPKKEETRWAPILKFLFFKSLG